MIKSDNDFQEKEPVSRRRFLGQAAAATAAFTIVPGHVIAGMGHTPPGDKLNIAGIGIGGKGKYNLRNMAGQNIVALCDVDWDYAGPVFDEYPRARKYRDYRVMLEKQKDIDACMIATPDHTHAIPAMMAMQMGKHVYVQKPLTHSVWESRQLAMAARKYRVATQMGNEGHSSDEVMELAEMIQSGLIGDIREIHTWSDRPIWPQGLRRPVATPEVPETLSWDLFLGPAPERPYHPDYTPWDWRAWWDYGTGALGDMGCHILDTVFYSMNLKYPVKVHASSTEVNMESAPHASRVHFVFPERNALPNLSMPEVEVTWHDGGLLPERPEELPDGKEIWPGGNLFIGEKGKILCSTYAREVIVLPEGLTYSGSGQVHKRIPDHPLGGGRHEMEWVEACKTSPESREGPSSNFDYAGPLTEMVVMGNLAVRAQSLHRILEWKGEEMEFTNIGENEEMEVLATDFDTLIEEKNRYGTRRISVPAREMVSKWVKHEYREGWSW